MSISSSIIIGIFTPKELLDPCHLKVIGDLDTHEQIMDCGPAYNGEGYRRFRRRGRDVQD